LKHRPVKPKVALPENQPDSQALDSSSRVRLAVRHALASARLEGQLPLSPLLAGRRQTRSPLSGWRLRRLFVTMLFQQNDDELVGRNPEGFPPHGGLKYVIGDYS